MRGKDIGLRRSGIIVPSPKKAELNEETKQFLLKFIDKLEIELLEITKDKLDVSAANREHSQSPREVAMAGLEYLRACISVNQPLTKSGMELFVCGAKRFGFMSKHAYFKEVLERLLGFVEMYNESALHTRQNPIGAIFVLKNMGWADTMDLNVRPAPIMTVEERLDAKKRIANFSE